jgi:hypothetical protein
VVRERKDIQLILVVSIAGAANIMGGLFQGIPAFGSVNDLAKCML